MMKKLILCLVAIVLSCTVAVLAEEMALNDECIKYVNSLRAKAEQDPEIDESAYWIAGRNPRFEGVTLAEAKQLLMDFKFTKPVLPMSTNWNDTQYELPEIPTSFDARQQWPQCTPAVRNQGSCGSCWAFAGVSTLAHRMCIASQGATKVVLSPQMLISCDSKNLACNGGWMQYTWDYMIANGVVTDQCFPYVGSKGRCPFPGQCPSGSSNQRYYGLAGSVTTPRTVAAIQTEILMYGPVAATYVVYQDFYNYKSGVYSHTWGSAVFGHAIKIVGWGISGNTPYWIVENSWGTEFGQQGYFWIKRGTNECEIESGVMTGRGK